jgi:hypothetical protein
MTPSTLLHGYGDDHKATSKRRPRINQMKYSHTSASLVVVGTDIYIINGTTATQLQRPHQHKPLPSTHRRARHETKKDITSPATISSSAPTTIPSSSPPLIASKKSKYIGSLPSEPNIGYCERWSTITQQFTSIAPMPYRRSCAQVWRTATIKESSPVL